MNIGMMQALYAVKHTCLQGCGMYLNRALHVYTTEVAEDMFLCSEDSPHASALNVTELQFCDGIEDCPDGSDEPEHCPSGTATCLHACIMQ